MKPGLRALKKQAARQRISDAATELFIEYGFDNVTVAEIAQVAGFSKVTVFNYFPHKEDMLLDCLPKAELLLADAIRDRPRGRSVVDAVRALMHQLLAEEHPLSGSLPNTAAISRVIAGSPALRVRIRERLHELELSVAIVLAEETGDTVRASLVARLLVAAVSTVVTTAARRLVAGELASVVATAQIGVIDRVFDLLAHGIHEYGADAPRSPA